jgi:small subunit ribosomal protein S2
LASVSVQELIRAGAHFGHRTSRWNPKMAPYIFKKRNLIHIIDVKATVRGLITAKYVAEAVAAKGDYVLFVGTKRQAQPIVRQEAERCGMPHVADRWPGGLLTNYVTIRKRLDRLLELEELERSGEINGYSKKMISSLRRERHKIERNLGGVRNMDRMPGLLVIVDPKREQIALREARKLGIPTIAWVDTDGDPDNVDVVVPANDDSIGAIEIFLRTLADAVLEGRRKGECASPQKELKAPADKAPPSTHQASSSEAAGNQ